MDQNSYPHYLNPIYHMKHIIWYIIWYIWGPYSGGMNFDRYFDILYAICLSFCYENKFLTFFLFLDHLFRRNKLPLFLHQFENVHLYMLLRHIFDNDLSNQPNYKNTIQSHTSDTVIPVITWPDQYMSCDMWCKMTP